MPSTLMKKERIARKWTQAYVAEKLGLTITSISDIENSKAKPSYKVLCELEILFGMSHRQLFKILD